MAGWRDGVAALGLALGMGLGVGGALLAAPAAMAHEGGHERVTPPWQEASAWPDRIVATFAGDPARTLAVNWRTDASAPVAVAEIARATPDARFDLAAQAVTARTEVLDPTTTPLGSDLAAVADNAGLPVAHFHSVVFEGLEPDTLYAYRVQGGDGRWSEWFQIRTAPVSGPIRFIYLGDAQNGILSHWARVVRAAFQAAPDARFILHAGDLVDKASHDYEWAQWFKAVGFIHGMIPAMPVAGNHEYYRISEDREVTTRLLSIVWRPQFTLPVEESLPETLHETVYAVRYSDDLEVFVLDTQNPDIAVQAAWLDGKLAASTTRWQVVSFHHPVFSSARDRDNVERRALILPVLERHEVDLVLQGHDHTYARGATPQTPERVASTQGETIRSMFVNSVSGAKQYESTEGGWDRYGEFGVELDRAAENTQFFQVIEIDGDTLDYAAYTADGGLYDAFTLRKDEAGQKRLVEGVASTMVQPRSFANTAGYPGTDGLND